MSNVVYWDELSRDDQYAVLTEAIRREYVNAGRLWDVDKVDTFCLRIIFSSYVMVVANLRLLNRCGELRAHPVEIVNASRICKGKRDGFFSLMFSRDDLDPEGTGKPDFSRFWHLDMNEEFVDSFEPMLPALASGVPAEDVEWSAFLGFDKVYPNESDLKDLSLLAADFAARVSAGDPCNLATWREAVRTQVNYKTYDDLFKDRYGRCHYDATPWVKMSFLRDIAERPYHCSSLGCDITVRS